MADAVQQLADGTPVLVRPLEPELDRAVYLHGFDELSAEARYMRFGAAVPSLTPAMLGRLLDHVDGVHHVALVAMTTRGEPVGVARFVREVADPSRAEVAITVIDAWQRRGAGLVLITALRDAALELGIKTFTATVLASNTAALRLLGKAGGASRTHSTPGVVEVEIDLVDAAGADAAGAAP